MYILFSGSTYVLRRITNTGIKVVISNGEIQDEITNVNETVCKNLCAGRDNCQWAYSITSVSTGVGQCFLYTGNGVQQVHRTRNRYNFVVFHREKADSGESLMYTHQFWFMNHVQ